MRRVLRGVLVATVTLVGPAVALAGNQEVADEIARNLREKGQLSDYKVGVEYQDGTARLTGRVGSPEEMNSALKAVFSTSGVTRVVNDLAVGRSRSLSASQGDAKVRFGKVEGDSAADVRPALAKETASADGQTTRRTTRTSAGQTAGRVQRTSATEPQTRVVRTAARANGRPLPIAYTQAAMPADGAAMPGPDNGTAVPGGAPGAPMPEYATAVGGGPAPMRYDQPHMPAYAWPSYASYPNYAAVTYPKQYSPTAWPFIGPFYPYPQVPLGWRQVTLQWDDGWWFLDFKDQPANSCWSCP